jgi:hypothetical protein
MWSLAGSVFMGFFSFVGALVFVRILFLESLFLDYYIKYFYFKARTSIRKKGKEVFKKACLYESPAVSMKGVRV